MPSGFIAAQASRLAGASPRDALLAGRSRGLLDLAFAAKGRIPEQLCRSAELDVDMLHPHQVGTGAPGVVLHFAPVGLGPDDLGPAAVTAVGGPALEPMGAQRHDTAQPWAWGHGGHVPTWGWRACIQLPVMPRPTSLLTCSLSKRRERVNSLSRAGCVRVRGTCPLSPCPHPSPCQLPPAVRITPPPAGRTQARFCRRLPQATQRRPHGRLPPETRIGQWSEAAFGRTRGSVRPSCGP